MKKFEPRLCSFNTLFKKRRLIIPSDFQRSYKWTKKFWKSWLKDIIELVKLNQVNEIHFVGGIAIKQNSEQNQTDLYIDYQIIDGQQRITTVFILLLAILNSRVLDETRAKDAEIIFHIRELLYLEKKRDEEERNKIRLLTTPQVGEEGDEEREDILTKIIEKSSDLETLKGNKIWEGYKFFVGEIKKGKLARDLDLIVEKIKENLMFILIETDAQEDGRKVFETINHSKLDLTQADEIKLFLSTRCKEESFSERKWITKWDTLVKNVKEENLNHLFFVYLNKHEKKRGRYSGSEFVGYFKKWTNKNKPLIKVLLDEMIEISNIYKQILIPSHDFWDEEFYQQIIELNILGKRTKGLYSFVILLKKYGEDDDAKRKSAASILEKIILFVFRGRFWGDKGANWHEIDRWNEKVRDNQLDTILQDPSIVKEVNSVGFWGMLEKQTDASKEKNKYLLARFYFTLVPKSTFPNLKNLEMEHIFPENPRSEWFTISQWKGLKEKVIKEKYLNSIGNLTLLGSQQNISSSNHIWDNKKKEVQEKTFLALENNELDLFNEEEFLPEHIDIRRKWLITQFKDKSVLFIDSDKEKKLLEKLEESN